MITVDFGIMTHLLRNAVYHPFVANAAATYLLYIAGKIRTVVQDRISDHAASSSNLLGRFDCGETWITLFFIEKYKSTSYRIMMCRRRKTGGTRFKNDKWIADNAISLLRPRFNHAKPMVHV